MRGKWFKMKKYKCLDCGLEVEEIPKFKKKECEGKTQHSFAPIKSVKNKKTFFAISKQRTIGIRGDDSTDILEEIRLSPEQMEKFLDDIPPTKNTQRIKRKVWSWF